MSSGGLQETVEENGRGLEKERLLGGVGEAMYNIGPHHQIYINNSMLREFLW